MACGPRHGGSSLRALRKRTGRGSEALREYGKVFSNAGRRCWLIHALGSVAPTRSFYDEALEVFEKVSEES
jgi:hypothetical protein